MANYYSDHYTTTVGGGSQDDPRIKVAAGVDHAAVRYKRATATVAAGVTDDEQVRFFQLKSSDRLSELRLSTPSLTGTTMTSDLGIYATDGGAVIDLDLFCAAGTSPCDDLSVAVARVDCFALAVLEDEDRGKQLWELAAEGAATYTVDPNSLIDVVLTMNTETLITVGAEFVLEAWYTAGGGS